MILARLPQGYDGGRHGSDWYVPARPDSLATRLRPDGAAVHAELLRQCRDADSVRAGCSHSVHFAVGEACSRSFAWFRRRPDQRVIRLSDRGGILADALIPRGNKPLDPWSPVPVVLDCVHPAHRARTLANGNVGGGSGLGLFASAAQARALALTWGLSSISKGRLCSTRIRSSSSMQMLMKKAWSHSPRLNADTPPRPGAVSNPGPS